MHNNDLIKELGFNFINYAAAVNTDRAIPDATSGLKPVARKILYGAYDGGRVSTKPHVKCARIVGDVMGNLHPHGDSSIYGALVRLAQPWIMRYPLIDFHGNMGNIDGDGPAAARYTEARLSKISEDGMLNGIKKHNVPFGPNYDETLEEPLTLPAIFPNLLCNPNMGLGVAIACNWLPHNLTEVAQAIYDYMEGEPFSLPGPDFPTGGVIINKNDIPKIMETGHGSVKVRGKYKIEKQNIVFYEIPYGVTTEKIMDEIGEVADSKEIEGINDVRNESTLKGMRIVIQCDKSFNPDDIARKLFIKTNLQHSISYNQVALVDKTPVELNLRDCIEIYIEHNENCLIKETEFDKNKAETRQEIVEGLLKALEDIDNIITLIKKSKSSIDAREQLIEKYKFSENQAKAIVNMKLGSLAGLEKLELQNEAKDLIAAIENYNNILNFKDTRLTIIRERLSTFVKKYGDKRRTDLIQLDIKPEEKEIATVTPEDVVVTLTKTGNIKKVPTKSFRVQKRNGKGVKSENDIILDSIKTNTIDTLMFFTDKGKMYRTIVDNVPTQTNAGKGVSVGSLIKLEGGEKIIAMTSLHRKTTPKYVVFFTKQGLVKKTTLEEYTKVKRNTGIQAIKINDGDSIANVTFLDEEEVILVTKNGMTIHFETKSINPIGRVSAGVKGIKLGKDDKVLVGLPIHKVTDAIALFTTKGMGKKCDLRDFPIQGRGGKGVLGSKYALAGAEMIDDSDNILVSGSSNSICISATDIPIVNRISTGNIMIKGDIISVVKI